MVVHTYNPGTRESEAGRLLCVQGQPRLHSEHKASVDYKDPHLKSKSKTKNKNTLCQEVRSLVLILYKKKGMWILIFKKFY